MKKISLVLIVLFIGILAACSSTTNKNEKEGTKKSNQGFVTYEDDTGKVEVPKNPKRIVIAADYFAGYPLALGVKPVGLGEFALSNDYFNDYVDGIENFGSYESVEAILALKPDLIVAFSTTKNLDELRKIAPTVAFEPKKRNFREQVLAFGELLNKQQEAEKWVADWDKQITSDKEKVHKHIGSKTISIFGVGEKEILVYGNKYSRGADIIYDELDIKAPELIQKDVIEGEEGYAAISLEKLPDFAGDFIFMEENAEFREITKSAIWQGLDAVKNDHIFMIDETNDFFNDPISLEEQRKFIVESLTK